MNREKLWYKKEADRKKVLPAAIRTMAEALTKAIQPITDSFSEYTDAERMARSAPEKIDTEAISDGYMTLYQGAMPKFAKKEFRALHKSADPDYIMKQDEAEQMEDVWKEYTRRYVETELPSRIKGVAETTQKRVRSIIQKGIDEGLSVDEIANQIDTLGLDDIIKNRSRVISRTELVNISNKGTQMGAKTSDLPLNKVWLTTIDGRQRPRHGQADGETVDINKPFTRTGEDLDYPGDPSGSASNVIQCRCAISHKVKGGE